MLPGHFKKIGKKSIFFLENFDLVENSLSPRRGEVQWGASKGDSKGKNTEIPFSGTKNRVRAR